MHALQFLLASVALVSGLALAAPAIAPVEPPPRGSFDPRTIARGAELNALGNCNVCHTADGGRPFAGGRPLETPFGIIHGTNITPEPETGIGRWSEAAFRRAMHEGVDRAGRHLYPVFPYDHFTKLSDEDVAALYAFMMTREPVVARTPPNRLLFPYNLRAWIGVWKALYFVPGRYQPNPAQSAEWNRGAYLVEGAGHCGACHTPRNFLGAEKRDRPFAGGEAGGWHAPALNAESQSPVPWTVRDLDTYLRTGLADAHAIAAGPMAPVVANLASVTAENTRAIATYVAALLGPVTPEQDQRAAEALARARNAAAAPPSDLDASGVPGSGKLQSTGAVVYAGACGGCHDTGRTTSSGGALHLALAIAVALPTPSNLIHLTLEGVAPPPGTAGRFMPGFAGALTNEQVTALVHYLRAEFGRKPPWHHVDRDVAKIAAEMRSP